MDSVVVTIIVTMLAFLTSSIITSKSYSTLGSPVGGTALTRMTLPSAGTEPSARPHSLKVHSSPCRSFLND